MLGGVCEFIGFGEVWDAIGLGTAVVSTGINIYELEEGEKEGP